MAGNVYLATQPMTWRVTPDNPDAPTSLRVTLEGFYSNGTTKKFVRVYRDYALPAGIGGSAAADIQGDADTAANPI